MDERLNLVAGRIAESSRLFARAVDAFERWRVSHDEMFEKAFQKFAADAYSECEGAFRAVLRLAGAPEPVGPDWHAEIAAMVHAGAPDRPPLLAEMARDIAHLRAFRHVCLHAYRGFDPERAELAVRAMRRVGPALAVEFQAFVALWTGGDNQPSAEATFRP